MSEALKLDGERMQTPATKAQQVAQPNMPTPVQDAPTKVDLSRLPKPGNLKVVRLEETTIDGICGVY